jgi:mRNA interferase RelE/StbE
MARVFFTRSAREALLAPVYPRSEAVLDALGALERDPTLGYELHGRLRGLRSYRVGAYRIIYQLRGDNVVRVVAIATRPMERILARSARSPRLPTSLDETRGYPMPGFNDLESRTGEVRSARHESKSDAADR